MAGCGHSAGGAGGGGSERDHKHGSFVVVVVMMGLRSSRESERAASKALLVVGPIPGRACDWAAGGGWTRAPCCVATGATYG